MSDLTLQEQYTQEIGKLPNNKKNDLERIQSKLDAFRNGDKVDSTPDEDGNETPEEGMITKKDPEAITPELVDPVEPTPETTDKENTSAEVVTGEKNDAEPVGISNVITPTPEVARTNVQHTSLLQIQSFHGIINEELYNDDVLVNKYHLSKDELKIIRSYTKKTDKDIDLNLNYHEMPDYIQIIFNKYGINGETIKDEEKLKEIIFGGKEPTKEQEQELHQLKEYYHQLRKDSLENSLIVENPALQNPSTGGKDIPAL